MTKSPKTPTPATPADLRVVFFSDSFRHRNGVGAYYCDLLAHLAPRVAIAELVCPGLTPYGKQKKQQGLSIPLPGDSSQKLCLPGMPKAYSLVKQIRPHVIVAASPGPYGMLAAALAWRFKTPFCFGYHTQYDQLTDIYWNRVFGALGKRYLAWLDRRFFNRSDAVFTNGRNMVQAAESMGARRIELIGTPIDPLLLKPPLPFNSHTFGPALFVGRLAPEKNIPKIIDAAKAVPNLQFIIAGDGPLAAMVKDADAELPNLDYVGWISREKLLELLDTRCELLLLPSRVESFGTVAAEAMARQRLVVVSDQCGIVDWPELASGLEIMKVDAPLTPTLENLAKLASDKRAEKRELARKRCLAFVEKTISDWHQILFDVATS